MQEGAERYKNFHDNLREVAPRIDLDDVDEYLLLQRAKEVVNVIARRITCW